MGRVTGFPPVVSPDAKVLILGSMPGRASLEKNEYYALPRNGFWKIMGDLFGAGFDQPYTARLKTLSKSRVGLWDVLEACDRQGSLDAAIETATVRPNDFEKFFEHNRNIRHVFFNGKKAAEIYMRRVHPKIETTAAKIEYETLPSTSPAHASMAYAEKLAAWSAIVPAAGR
jgi:TDG/mug DNA glycosylase family protein